MTDLFKVSSIREEVTYSATCLECERVWGEGFDARLPAVQHTKKTGHSVTVYRSEVEIVQAVKSDV